MRLVHVLAFPLLAAACSPASSSGTACTDRCACFTTRETCPSGCFATYAADPDAGTAGFVCGDSPQEGVTFDPYFFYCHVEPEFLFADKCGPGDPSLGDAPGGCHFTASAVSGMVLQDHPAIACNASDLPLDLTQVAPGTPANANYMSASLEMTSNVTTAPIFVRPSSTAQHPRAVFETSDPTVDQLLATWASR
jgi:hypothetical protein